MRWWREIPPATGSAVMATGIVSVGLHLTGPEPLSLALLAIAVALWLVLAAAFVLTFLRDRATWTLRAATPPALTAVAATCVIGTRLSLSGRQLPAVALLALAVLAWPGLLASVLRHWQRHLPGAVFLVCVSTEALAVLSTTLALGGQGAWLPWPALACFVLGLVLYGAALAHFDLRQVLSGAGDQWVAAGALSISALAAAKLTSWREWTGPLHEVLRGATSFLLCLALAWYLVLLVAEVRRPRLRFDVRRWATVFPLGMTAVAALTAATAIGAGWLHPLGSVLLWIAAAAWALTAAGFLASAVSG